MLKLKDIYSIFSTVIEYIIFGIQNHNLISILWPMFRNASDNNLYNVYIIIDVSFELCFIANKTATIHTCLEITLW